MIENKVLYSLDDVMIQPAAVTFISHRGDIKTTYDDGMLPLFTSPMPCVVSLKDNQYKKYLDAKINAIIPRTEGLVDRISFLNHRFEHPNVFVAFSLDEFNDIFINHKYFINIGNDVLMRVLVDIACGSMYSLHDSIKTVKAAYGNKICIMSGNVANPESFYKLAEAGCDYIRCSVGSGSGCCTATYTGVYYPMASLIDECRKKSDKFATKPKIIADGGITTYRNAFKALALGADYVMMGSRLCQCEDSAGEIIDKGESLRQRYNRRKLYFGMASEMGSQLLGKDATAPEGMVKEYPVLEPIAEYGRLFSRYLASTMSYCNAIYLRDFIGKCILNPISQNAQKQFNQ